MKPEEFQPNTDDEPHRKPSPTDLKSKISTQTSAARAVLNDGRDAISSKAHDLASEAGEVLQDRAQKAQSSLADQLTSFSQALRSAGDHLQGEGQSQVAGVVSKAAGGLDALSTSVRDKPLQAVLEDVRAFGKSNPGTLLAGSALVGLAIARFVKSTAPQPSQQRNVGKTTPATDLWNENASRSPGVTGASGPIGGEMP